MKSINKVIEELTKKSEMYMELSFKKLNEGDDQGSTYNEGIAEGILKAIKEIEYVNEQLTRKLNDLI